MAFVDACWFTAGSSGTADFADGTALSAFRSMAGAGAVDGEVYSYRAESIDRTQWEMGYGAYSSSGNTLARTVTASSAGGTTKVDFSAAPIVSLQPLARDFGNLVPFTAASSSGPASLDLAEDTDSGSNKVTLAAPSSLGSDVAVTLPSSSGTLPLDTLGQGQHTIFVPAGAMTPATTNGAARGTGESTTNKVMRSTLDFDASTEEFAQFFVQMPKSWNESTVVAQFIWSHGSTTTNFGVVWGVEALALANDDSLDTAWGTEVAVADTGGTTDDIYISDESSAITVAGSPGDEEFVLFRITRVVGNGSDTMAVDARLHGVKIHYTTNAATDD